MTYSVYVWKMVMADRFTCVISTVALVCSAVVARAQQVQLVSVSNSGEQANAACSGSMCGNGSAVVFDSQATNLIENDSNGNFWDVFVRDLDQAVTAVVSVNSSGEQAAASCNASRISLAGQFVIFQSQAINLVPGGSNGHQQVFFHDRQTNQTEMISVSPGGSPGTWLSSTGYLSVDGRFVTFSSLSSNIVAEPYNTPQCFIRDRLTGETSIFSISSTGEPVQSEFEVAPGAGNCSDDGRYVVFHNIFNDLAPGAPLGASKIYVRDRLLGTTQIVTQSFNGSPINGESTGSAKLSADGRLVAFSSLASNLVPEDTNGVRDVFVRDLLLQHTARVNLSSEGEQANAGSPTPVHISANGRFITFNTEADNLVPDDTNQKRDGFVHDRWTGTTELVTLNWQGEQLDANSGITGITDDGRVISFTTTSNNVIAGTVNGFIATYVRERWKLGDVNRDGVVNVIDLLAIINAWGPCPAAPPPPALPIPCDADVTNDNTVNVADLLLIINNWG